MNGGAWWAAVHGVVKSQTRLSNFTFTFYFHALEKETATHFCVLAWRIPGTGEPGGLPSMGSHRVGHDWGDLAAAAAAVFLTSLMWAPCKLRQGSHWNNLTQWGGREESILISHNPQVWCLEECQKRSPWRIQAGMSERGRETGAGWPTNSDGCCTSKILWWECKQCFLIIDS